MTQIVVKLLSDSCFGGTRLTQAGDVDVCQAVDDAGLPTIGGRILKGLLVEEVSILLRALEGHEHLRDWEEAAAEAFGVPGSAAPGKLEVRDAGFAPEVREKIRTSTLADPQLLGLATRAMTVVRNQTAIDPKTGVARPHSLRGTRLAKRGLELRGELAWDGASLSSAPKRSRALVAAAVKMLRRGGVNRTRGWGRLSCSILESGETVCGWETPLCEALQQMKEGEE